LIIHRDASRNNLIRGKNSTEPSVFDTRRTDPGGALHVWMASRGIAPDDQPDHRCGV